MRRRPALPNAKPACDGLCGGGKAPSNPGELARMDLGPGITLRPLCTVAVLVGSQRSRTTGSPAGILARLWVQ